MRVRSLLLLFVTIIFNAGLGITVAKAQITNPGAIPGLTLWLSADSGVVTISGGDSITEWTDLSGNGYSTTGPTHNLHDSLPTLVSHEPLLNNKPTIAFNGTTSMFYGPQMQGVDTSSLTFFIVATGNSEPYLGNYTAGLFRIGPRPTGLWLYQRFGNTLSTGDFVVMNNFGTANLDIPEIAGAMPDAGFPYAIWGMKKTTNVGISLYENGVAREVMDSAILGGPFTNAPYEIANTNLIPGFLNLHGEIAEIIIYSAALTDSQMHQVESYIYNKYAPPVSLGPDINQPYKLCGDTLNAGNGYVSYLWSTGATSSYIVVKKSGSYSVTVTDVFGNVSSDSITVSIPSITLSTLASETVCYGQTLDITAQIANPSSYSYLWSDGLIGSSTEPDGSGAYYVKVTDSTGCWQMSDTTIITVDSLGAFVSLGADTTLCNNSLLGLESPSTGLSALQFQWSNTSTDSIITVNASGAYSVTVTDGNNCSATASKTVNLNGSSAANVNFDGDTLCFGQIFTPVNLSGPIDSIASYLWNFGDGKTAPVANPTHSYAVPGLYTVQLNTVTYSGCSKSINKPVEVDAIPVASFGGNTGCVNNSYQFIDLSSVNPGNTIISWNWSFGDSTTSDTSNPYHVYPLPGTYPVKLSVTDNLGCTGNTTHSVSVAYSQFHSPTLIAPANSASVGNTNVFFAWNAVPEATRYSLEISTTLSFSSPLIYNLTSTQDTVYGLQADQTYYWMVVARDPCNDSAPSKIDTLNIFSPSNFGCLTLWLRADSGVTASNGNVSEWNDWSGNSNNAASSNGDPTLAAEPILNNMPSLKFNGINASLKGDAIPNIQGSSLTIFVVNEGDYVATNLNTNLAAGLFTVGDLSTGMWVSRRMYDDQDFNFTNNYGLSDTFLNVANSMPNSGYPYGLYEVQKTFGVQVTDYINSKMESNSNNTLLAGGFTNTNYVIGECPPPYNYLTGRIAEVIVYTCALADNERAEVENYIYNKYAPPVYLGPDIVQPYIVCPVTLNTGGRFANYLWSTGATTSQITVNQSGTYWVSVTDVFGRTSSDTINVTIPYQGSSPAADTTICLGASATIAQIINDPNAYQYHWNTGALTTTITVSAPGLYYCAITDSTGCTINTDTVKVIVDSISLAQLILPDTLICSGSGVTVMDSGRQIVSYLWTPGNDTSRNFIIDTSGAYQLSVTDIYGCIAQDSVNVNTHAHAPSASFQTPNLCLGGVSDFINLSQAVSPDAFDAIYWNFGGGNPDTSTQFNPSTLYGAFGQYVVTLNVITDSGCTAAATKTITVYPNPAPAFTYTGSNSANENGGIICAQSYVVFTDTSLAVGGDSIVNRVWKFNGKIDSSESPIILYLFNQEGIYDATLVVTNDKACSDSITQTVSVYAPFKAEFSDENVCLGDTTIFTDLTQSLAIVSWNWDFGDLNSSNIENPEHIYQFATNYAVSLTVENAIGCVSNITKDITIVQAPVANFTDTSGCVNQNYSPVDSSVAFNQPIDSWMWNIHGRIFNTQTPQYYFIDTGTFMAKLVVSTQSGCADSITKSFEIYPLPTAGFTYTPSYGTAPVDVSFINTSQNATSYIWQFGDGEQSFQVNPQHTYTQDSVYNVTLYAINGYGCQDAVSQIYQAIPTSLDIQVDAVFAYETPQPDGSVYVEVVAQVSNVGTRLITSADFEALLGNGETIIQNWTGSLSEAQTIFDTMPTQFDVPGALANTYLCVTALNVNNGQQETNVNNNTACTSLNGNLQLQGPSPNPGGSQSVLGLIMPQAGQVTISIYDELGRYIVRNVSLHLPVGRTDYQIPVQQMEGGEYYINVVYNNNSQVRTFVAR